MKFSSMMQAALLAAAFAAAPFTLSRDTGLRPNDACAQVKIPGTGTCCIQQEAACVTPTGNLPARYYKAEGPCPVT